MAILTSAVDAAFSTRLTLTLLHFLWQGCVGGALVIVGGAILKEGASRRRYALNVMAMLLMALCLPVTFLMVTIPDSAIVKTDATQAVQESAIFEPFVDEVAMPVADSFDVASIANSEQRFGPDSNAFDELPLDVAIPRNIPLPTSAVGTSRILDAIQSISQWVSVLYLFGVALVLARLMIGVWGGHRLRKVANIVKDRELLEIVAKLAHQLGLKIAPTVAWCEQISIPVVVGVIRPTILLPIAVVTGLTPHQLQALMLHEMAHIRRFDPIVNLLQRIIEAILFFHPVVWFVSRRISIEREHAADDMVLAVGWDRPNYADALVRVAELSSTITRSIVARPATVLGASGTSPSEFKLRILRLLGETHPQALQPSRLGILTAFAVVALGGVLAWSQTKKLDANDPNAAPDATNIEESVATTAVDRPNDQAGAIDWGQTVNGLRSRIVPVQSSMRDDAIDPTQQSFKFAQDDDLAFIVEIENVSDKPIILLDARNGNGSTDWNGQFLYSFDLFDGEGTPIERPEVQVVDLDSVLGNVFVETLAPGKTHRVLLRPSKWLSPFRLRLEPGHYRAAAHYVGLPARVAKRIREYRPDSPALAAIEGDITTAPVAFQRQPAKLSSTPNEFEKNNDVAEPTLVWGHTTNGLRAAVSFNPERSTYSHGEKVETKLHVKNVSDKAITLSSMLWLSDLKANVKDADGDAVEVGSVWYTGHTMVARVILQPQQVVVFDAGNLGLAVTKARAAAFEHMTHRTLVVPAGTYSIQLEGRFGNSFQLKDGNDNVLAPQPGDWVGELKTGDKRMTVDTEKIDCNIVDSITGKLISDTTTSFRFIKPATADSEEVTVSHLVWGPKGPGQIFFMIPVQVMQRADREELEVRWGVGGNADYELLSPAERIPLKQFFAEGPKAARETLSTIKLTPKKKEVKVENVGDKSAIHLYLSDLKALANDEDGDVLGLYPKLRGLSPEMSEQQFLEMIEKQKLISQKFQGYESTIYKIPADDEFSVIVKFSGQGEKCKIRRVRSTPQVAVRHLRNATYQLRDHLNVMAVGFVRDSKDLVSVSTETDVALRKWNLEDKSITREAKLATDKHGNRFLMGHLTLSGNGQRVIAAVPDRPNAVGIWDTTSGKLVKTLSLPQEFGGFGIGSLACNHDLSLIVCELDREHGLSRDGQAIVLDVASGRVVQSVTHVGAVQLHSVALSPDGTRFATGGQAAGMSVWAVSTGNLIYSLPNDNAGLKHPDPEVTPTGANQVLCIQFSPDGKQLAFGDMLGVKLVDAESGQLRHQLDAPFRYGRSGLVFSKDSQWLARVAADKVVPIWATETGQRRFELSTESNAGAFSDDNSYFAVGFSDSKNAVGVWNLVVEFEANNVPLSVGTAVPNDAVLGDKTIDAKLGPLTDDDVLLSDAVANFNARNKKRDRRQDQPSLTEDEVLDAIARCDWKRDVPDVSEREFAAFKNVGKTGRLPVGAEIEVLTGLQPDAFTLIDLWSIRINMPALEREGTVGFTIRNTTIREERIDAKSVAWGKPDQDGLSLGLFLSPKKETYRIGDRAQLRLFVRNEGKNPVSGLTFYNITWPVIDDFTVTDQAGASVVVRNGHEDWSNEMWPAGAQSGNLGPGDVHAFRVPFEVAFGDDDLKNHKEVGRIIDGRPGQILSIRVRASNGNDDRPKANAEKQPETGSIKVVIAEAEKQVGTTDRNRKNSGLVSGDYSGASQVMRIAADGSISYGGGLGLCHMTLFEDDRLKIAFQDENRIWNDVLLMLASSAGPEQQATWRAQVDNDIYHATATPTPDKGCLFRLEHRRNGKLIGGSQQFFAVGKNTRDSESEPERDAAARINLREWRVDQSGPGVVAGTYTGIRQVIQIGKDGSLSYHDQPYESCQMTILDDNRLRATFLSEDGAPAEITLPLTTTAAERRASWSIDVDGYTLQATAIPYSSNVYLFRLGRMLNGKLIEGSQEFYAIEQKLRKATPMELAEAADSKTDPDLRKVSVGEQLSAPKDKVKKPQPIPDGPNLKDEKETANRKKPVTLRLLGGESKTPLAGISVELTNGHGSTQKKYGPFETDETGSVTMSLVMQDYEVHLKSTNERPYLPVDESWNKAPRGPTPALHFYMTETGLKKWVYPERIVPIGDSDDDCQITFTLLPASELVLRAVDAETGKGLAGVEFYEENAVGEEWGHPIYGKNLGSKFERYEDQPEGFLTDDEGNFKRLVGANAGYTYGVEKAPKGYEGIDRQDVEIDIVYGQKRAEHVFKFRRSSR